jgi:hypothetical protein
MEQDDRPPYGSYASIAATFAGGLTAATLLAKLLNREPRELDALDLVTLSAATFKLSRTISRDKVGSFVREPFVEGDAHGGDEEPAGEGVQRAIGELVTCTRCVGTWVAAGLGSAQVVAPRFGRLVCWTLAAGAANDFLQAGFVALTERAATRADA